MPLAPCYHDLKLRDTRPGIVATVYEAHDEDVEPEDRVAYDLTDADAVWLHVHLSDGRTFSREMTIDVDPTTGKAAYLWQAADWSSDPPLYGGQHRIEYEVVGPGDARLTYPNRDTPETRHYLRIDPDIGQES